MRQKAKVKIQCVQCGKIFETQGCWAKRGKKFCSVKCKNVYMEKYELQKCMTCGNEFKPHQKNRKFCSLLCAYGVRTGDVKHFNAECKYCGKGIRKKPSKNAVYCSQECRKKDKRIYKNCLNCGKEFFIVRSDPDTRNFCSFVCYRKYKGESSIEKKFREELEKRNIFFNQEVKFGRYSIDFVVGNIAIELDGNYWHDKENVKKRDKLKEEKIIENNYKFLRFKEKDIKFDIEKCFRKLNKLMKH